MSSSGRQEPGREPLKARFEAEANTRSHIESRVGRIELLARLFGDQAEPARVGRFEVHELQGEGAMGRVYAAYASTAVSRSRSCAPMSTWNAESARPEVWRRP